MTSMNMTNRTVDLALRALQLILAVIIMGTDGYGKETLCILYGQSNVGANVIPLAIHVFRSYTVYTETEFGNFYSTYDVPDAWGFLMFCAGWTFLMILFVLIAGIRIPNHVLIGYVRAGVETVALLSWLAGFIAVAINIGASDCSEGNSRCGLLKAATVFGALEWVLSMITTIPTLIVLFKNSRRPGPSPNKEMESAA